MARSRRRCAVSEGILDIGHTLGRQDAAAAERAARVKVRLLAVHGVAGDKAVELGGDVRDKREIGASTHAVHIAEGGYRDTGRSRSPSRRRWLATTRSPTSSTLIACRRHRLCWRKRRGAPARLWCSNRRRRMTGPDSKGPSTRATYSNTLSSVWVAGKGSPHELQFSNPAASARLRRTPHAPNEG